ncbi:MAG: hypothetical protein ABIT20_21075, partial [Gemmatimonadaceae bacterium]
MSVRKNPFLALSDGTIASVWVALLSAVACAAPGTSSNTAELPTDTAVARAQLVRLESDARALV